MNEKQKKWKLVLAGLMAGVLLGGTVVVATPSVAAGPAKIWKQIKKKADKRYYTKAKSDQRYAPKPKVIRGTYVALGRATQANEIFADNISFGNTFSAPPTGHVIPPGGVPPAGCSGTVEAPNASPGHLCVFQGFLQNSPITVLYSASVEDGSTSTMGALLIGYSAAAGIFQNEGSWAASPVRIVSKVAAKPTQKLSGRGVGR